MTTSQAAPAAGRRALITGITGQDGSYLAEQLLARGYEVVVPDPCVFARDAAAHDAALALLRDHWPRAWSRARTTEVTHPSGVHVP